MENHGEKLEAIIRDKGFSIRGIAEKLGVHRNSVDKQLRSQKISRLVLNKYAKILKFDVDEFYDSTIKQPDVESDRENGSMVPMELYIDLQQKFMDQQAAYIKLQAEFLELTKRFFPSATQQVYTQGRGMALV